MRVIAGTVKGTVLRAVPGRRTRPTTDKVKGAIFNRIGPYFTGGDVLDLFAGTGALAIEALSRGMDRAVVVDHDAHSIATIQHNVAKTHMQTRVTWMHCAAKTALRQLAHQRRRFEWVFLDPPYGVYDTIVLLDALQQERLVYEETTIVLEHHAKDESPLHRGAFVRYRHAIYGETAIAVYEHRHAEGKEQGDAL